MSNHSSSGHAVRLHSLLDMSCLFAATCHIDWHVPSLVRMLLAYLDTGPECKVMLPHDFCQAQHWAKCAPFGIMHIPGTSHTIVHTLTSGHMLDMTKPSSKLKASLLHRPRTLFGFGAESMSVIQVQDMNLLHTLVAGCISYREWLERRDMLVSHSCWVKI